MIVTGVHDSSRSSHSCAVWAGTLRCVGASATGALGQPRRRRSRTLLDVPLPGPARGLAVGPDFTCARLAEGPLCFGAGYGVRPRAPGSDFSSSVRNPTTP